MDSLTRLTHVSACGTIRRGRKRRSTISTVERAQAILGDHSLVALKEWEGLNGEMGVYRSHDHGYFYLLILIPSQDDYSTQSYPHTERARALHDAKFIAAFARAQKLDG